METQYAYPQLRLGLCCKFNERDVKFRTTTAAHQLKHSAQERLGNLAAIVQHNFEQLLKTVDVCEELGIGSFRIGSDLMPLATHAECGYRVEDLPNTDEIHDLAARIRASAQQSKLRFSFHPDQFVVLNSPRPEVVRNAIVDLEYHCDVAELVGADVINIHGGGVYGNKPEALSRLQTVILELPPRIRNLLTLENDDRSFTPEDLLPVCQATGVALVYDVHHHRCNPDSLSIEQATKDAFATWNREPMVHISSPREGWEAKNPRPHADLIDYKDFPACWLEHSMTIEIEAKAKEIAVEHLMVDLFDRRSEIAHAC